MNGEAPPKKEIVDHVVDRMVRSGYDQDWAWKKAKEARARNEERERWERRK